MVDKKVSIGDVGIVTESVSISVFRLGSLLPCARQLAKMVKKSEEPDLQCFAMSTIMMCTAAIEASLFEYAYKNEKTIYEDKYFRHNGIAKKYIALMGTKIEDDCKDVDELVNIRNAIVHNEPDHKSGRELDIAKYLTGDKTLWAVKTTEEFVESILGTSFN